jgi:plastocyanin
MSIRTNQSLAGLAFLALLAGCEEDAARSFMTAPTPIQPAPPADNPAIHFEHRGYPNAWEALGIVGTSISDHPFGVRVYDAKSMLSGLQIIWAVARSGASVTPTNDTTKNGISVATVTLGPEEGDYAVTATAPTLPGAPQLAFTATAVTLIVEVRDLADGGFVPANVTIPAGHSVGWRYASAEEDAHDVVFEDDPTQPVSSGDLWDLWAGRRFHTRLFEGPPRTIRYRCRYHSTSFVAGEVGTVTVK